MVLNQAITLVPSEAITLIGGYRANIVAYSIAKLSHATSQQLDLTVIWETQSLTPVTEEAVKQLIPLAWRVIVDDAPAGSNITEWAKREDCWRQLRLAPWTPPDGLAAELRRSVQPVNLPDSSAADETVAAVVKIGADGWFALEGWAKQTGKLAPWQRTVAHDIANRLAGGRATTPRQSQLGHEILKLAASHGWAP